MGFNVQGLETLLEKVTRKTLGEADLALRSGELKIDGSGSSEAVLFNAGAAASIDVISFNSDADTDDLGVVGTLAPEPLDPTVLQPQLPIAGRAYTRYAFRTEAKAGGGASFPFLAADADGKCTVVFADYYSHDLGESALAAVRADLAERPRCAALLPDVLRLKEGHAAAMIFRARLAGSVEIKWSDVFTSNLNRLTDLLRARTPVALEIDTGLTVSASVMVADDYALVFHRRAPDEIGFAVKKAKSRAPQFGAGISIEVAFADPNAVEEALGVFVQSVIGDAVSAIDGMFAATDPARLGDSERKLLEKVLEKLDLGGITAAWAERRAAWEAWKARLASRIEEVARSRIGGGFRYDYQRVSEHAALVEATVSDADLAKIHPHLVRGDVAGAVDSLRAAGKTGSITSYFNQDAVERSSSWGFSLSFGTWRLLDGKNEKKFRRSVQTSINDEKLIAYNTVRSYTGKLFGTCAWTVDLKADMSYFAANPSVRDFYFGLHLLYEHEESRLRGDELRQIVDEAIAWRVIDEDDENDAMEAIGRLVKDRPGPVKTHLEVKLDNEGFRALLPAASVYDPSAYARALARALPWADVNGRAIVPLREQLYAPLWRQYLVDSSLTFDELGTLAVNQLRKNPSGKRLVTLESTSMPASLREIARLQAHLRGVVRDCHAGFKKLSDGRNENWGAEAIPSALSLLEGSWTQYLYVRMFGALVVDLAASALGGLVTVERTLSATAGDRRIVIGVGKE